MYVNKCIRCGAEFETKNPKRVICPNCLYAEKGTDTNDEQDKQLKSYSSYSAADTRRDSSLRQYDNRRYDNRNNRPPYNNRRYDNRNDSRSSYPQRRYNNGGGYNNRPPQGRYNNQGDNKYDNRQRRNSGRFQQGGGRRPPQRKQAKTLLISKEQLERIEAIYRTMLPLPNPDAHEAIGALLEIEPRKVFFGINLVRQKLMLPKLPYPKRKLAVTPDQMTAIKSLYTPLLPLPPIGCHKIIAAQLKVDEWRVHVAIKLIRAQMGLDRWNEERPDKPADYLVPKYPQKEKKKNDEITKDKTADKAEDASDKPENTEKPADETPENKEKNDTAADGTLQKDEAAEPKKRGRKKKDSKSTETDAEVDATEAAAPKKRGRKKKEESPIEESATAEEAPKKRGRKPKKAEDE